MGSVIKAVDLNSNTYMRYKIITQVPEYTICYVKERGVVTGLRTRIDVPVYRLNSNSLIFQHPSGTRSLPLYMKALPVEYCSEYGGG
jgi:hypothetical protein